MKGRNPKPTAILQLEKGKLYSDQRDRAELEPKPRVEMRPRCPRRFSKAERAAWRSFAEVLKNYGLFTAANATELELLATAYSQYVECSRKFAENPALIGNASGKPIVNPYLKLQHKLGAIIDGYLNALGLSSIALAKIGSLALAAKKDADEFFTD